MQLLLSWPLMFFAIHLALGLALLWIACCPRRQHHCPLCRRCGGEVISVATLASPSCPSCGLDLSRARAVRFLKAKRSKALIMVALVALASAALWPSVLWEVMRPRPVTARITPSARFPLSRRATRSMLATSVVPGPPSWADIEEDAADKANPSVMPRALATGYLERAAREIEQGRASDPYWWDQNLFSAIALMLANHHLTREEVKPIFDALVKDQTVVVLSPAVRQGHPVRIRISSHGLEANKSWYSCHPVAFVGDGIYSPVSTLPNKEIRAYAGPGPYRGDLELGHSLPVGEHDLKLKCLLILAAGETFEWLQEFPVKLTVTPADKCAVELVNSPELAKQILAAVSVREFYVTPGITNNSLNARWAFGASSLVYYFDVWVSVGLDEYKVGSISGGKRTGGIQLAHKKKKPLPPDVRTVTVRLVPNPEKAELLFGADKLPAHPIILRDIPLLRYDLDETANQPAAKEVK